MSAERFYYWTFWICCPLDATTYLITTILGIVAFGLMVKTQGWKNYTLMLLLLCIIIETASFFVNDLADMAWFYTGSIDLSNCKALHDSGMELTKGKFKIYNLSYV